MSTAQGYLRDCLLALARLEDRVMAWPRALENPSALVLLAFRRLLRALAVQSARAVKASRRLASLRRRSTTFWHGVMRSRGV